MWTTVFSDDGDVAASEYDEETANLTQSSLVHPSSYREQRTSMTGSPLYHAKTSEVRVAEPQYVDEYLIYASKDQQDFLEQYGKESGNQEDQVR